MTSVTCPSCHQKSTLLTAIHVADEVCWPVAHRQVVLTIPKRLRLHTRFDRKLLGKLCSCAWTCIQAEVQRVLGRDDVLPGMIRYYGWYSNKSRGMRRKRQQAAAEATALGDRLASLGAGLAPPPISGPEVSPDPPPPNRASQTWAMLIKRVYEMDPLECPNCGGQMKVVAFIEPPQADVIEKILRHCGLWNPPPARPPPAGDASLHDPDEPRELTYVDSDTFEATLWADF
jgi:hypothetical protein